MKLYQHPISGHCHRVALYLSLTDTPYEPVLVDVAAGEQKSAAFLAKNAFGQVPVLEDDGVIIADSCAILVYLAERDERTDLYPRDPVVRAEIQRWFALAAGPLASGPAAARLSNLFGTPGKESAVAAAHQLFATVEDVLATRAWLAGTPHPTLADLALYSYAHAAPEGDVDLAAYPRLHDLLRRIEALPRFTPFPENAVGLRASA